MSRSPLTSGLATVAGAIFVLGACGGGASKPPAEPRASTPPAGEAPPRSEGPGAPPPAEPAEVADAETAEQIYARVQGDLVACYEAGRKAVPNMTSGRVTLNVAIDGSGKSMCVVASDDTGLTQEVEDCMSARVARETYKTNTGAWATELPILVKGGKVSLGPPATSAPALETVETHGMPDSAHEVVEALLPRLHECTQGSQAKPDLRVVHVGARVAKDGRVECAVASSAVPIPSRLRECAADTLAQATFPPPRSKVGLVSVPVKILARK